MTGVKAGEREVLLGMLESTRRPGQPGQSILGDMNYYGHVLESELADAGISLIRHARKGEKPRSGKRFIKPLRQIIESVDDTLKGQLDLEAHGGRTIAGVTIRVLQSILALTAAIWHNQKTGQPILRSLIACDH